MRATEQKPDRTAAARERYDVLATASSAGGIHGLTVLLAGLGADFPVPVVVVQHLTRTHRTFIAEVLSRRSALPVKLAEAGERITAGQVYVAPPDRHLLLRAHGVLELSTADLVHFVRPSADLLFISAADVYGPRALACVLTGTGVDGATGVARVKEAQGTVLAEDPASAEFDGMPSAAVATGAVDRVLPLEDLAAELRALVGAAEGTQRSVAPVDDP
ncbi:chemotaxis protein CheB [Streptomyces spiroverticillatus]|uniref:protein-glutamate methylesterase n=1 Tax=Streptomyces finlayi TaxID=67296 RepID=A0A918WRZ4_9ACTN|nr:chemotaxis protein CheB [Streptomyces finlayi]GGZ85058.1 chemotaxis protein CheB [Streptomyces spiroverticillatus]GHC76770.1 chemotaxis protein CheB [Streptomyces finlayi]